MISTLFMATLFILGVSGLGYGIYQNGNAQIKADDKYCQKVQSLEAHCDLMEARSMESEQELKRAKSRISLLNRELTALRPVGTLMKRNTQVLKQQEQAHGGIDPDTAGLQRVPMSHFHLYTVEDGNGDLPPMQLL